MKRKIVFNRQNTRERAFRPGFKLPSAAAGFLILILSVLLFAGIIPFRNDTKEAISTGNRLFASGDYTGAIKVYQKGLEDHPEQLVLYYNCGQAAYQLGDYSQAAIFYASAPDSPDKYINQGNSYLKLADAVEEPDLKLSGYQNALDTYKEGIICFPENTELKYNYEYVKKFLDQAESGQKGKEDGEKEQDQGEKEEKEQQEQEKDTGSGDNIQKESGSVSADTNSQAVSQTPQTDSEIASVMALIEQEEKINLKNNQEVNSQEEEGSANGW